LSFYLDRNLAEKLPAEPQQEAGRIFKAAEGEMEGAVPVAGTLVPAVNLAFEVETTVNKTLRVFPDLSARQWINDSPNVP